jgi:hypothetical protein
MSGQPVKRYVVFAFENMISNGGWSDFVASFDDLDEARRKADELPYDIVQVIDLTTGDDVSGRVLTQFD